MERTVFWPTKGTGGLQHHKALIFDGKQHPKNKYLVPWMLKSPLTSDPKNISSNTYNTYLTRTRFHLFENQSKYTYQVGFRFVIKLSCGLNRNRNFALVVNYLSCHHQVIHIVVHAAPCSTVM